MNINRKTILAVGGMVALLVVGVAFLAWPAYQKTRQINGATEQLLEKSKYLRGDTGTVKQLAQRVRELRAHVEQDLKSIPAEPRVAEMMRRLSLPVDGVTVRDQTFAAGAPKPAADQEDIAFRAVPLTVELDASFEAVFSLLRAAEQSPQLVRVKSVYIERHSQNNDESIEQLANDWLRASISLEAVHEPEEATASSEARRDSPLASDNSRSTS